MRKEKKRSGDQAGEPLPGLSIPLPELDCISCARRLRSVLEGIPGLEFSVNLADRRVAFANADRETITSAVAAIAKTGFDPRASSVLLPLFDLPSGSPAGGEISKALETVPGILRAIVKPLSQVVEVWYVPGETDLAEIRQRIRSTGHRMEAPLSNSQVESRLERLHRRSRLEAIAAVTAAFLVSFLSLPLAGTNVPTIPEGLLAPIRNFGRQLIPQLFSIEPVSLEIFLLLVTFGFLVWLGRGWMESGSFTLLGRNPDSNTAAAAAVFVLAAGLTISSIRVAWKEESSYAFPGYATLFWMIALYSLARLMELGERRRLRRADAEGEMISGLHRTDIQTAAESKVSLVLRIAITVAIAAFVIWFDFGVEAPLLYAVVSFTAVMIVTAPGIFGLGVPGAISAGIREARRRGIIFRDAHAFEELGRIRHVAIAKERLLTEGKPATTDFVLLEGTDQRTLLSMAAALASHARSPLARPIVERAGSLGESFTVSGFEEFGGQGFLGNVEGQIVIAGKPSFIRSRGFETDWIREEIELYATRGKNSVVVVIDGRLAGMIALQDALLEDAPGAIARLRTQGVTLHLFGQDESDVLDAVAAHAGIENVTGDIEPDRMRSAVAEALEQQRELTASISSDGHDALLTVADLAISLGTAEQPATSDADVLITRGGLEALAEAITLSRATADAASRNIRWGLVYHAVGILLATQILHPFAGKLISPALFALMMLLAVGIAMWNGRRFEKEAAAL